MNTNSTIELQETVETESTSTEVEMAERQIKATVNATLEARRRFMTPAPRTLANSNAELN